MTTTIKTDFARELTVRPFSRELNLRVRNTDMGDEIYTSLTHAEAGELASALAGENATVVTDLPEVAVSHPPFDTRKVVRAGATSYYINRDPESILTDAKELLAIHAFLVKHNAEQEEAKKAEAEAEAVKAKEAAKAKRRDELVAELSGYAAKYEFSTELSQKAVDRIIDLEEAAKEPAWT